MTLYWEPKSELLSLLTEKAYRKGTFTLASGKQSDFYINCKDAILTANGHRLVGLTMYEHILDTFGTVFFKAVAGVALGGCPLASAVSLRSILMHTWGDPLEGVLDALYVRKDPKGHGTQSLIEGKAPPGCRVILVEDVVTSGGSSLQAIKTLRAAGYQVPVVLALVDRLEGAEAALAAQDVKLQSLFTRHDFVK